MSGLTRDQVLLMALEAGFELSGGDVIAGSIHGADVITHDLERFAALAYAAGRASRAAEPPPPPMILDASKIDLDALVEAINRAGPPPCLVAVPARPDDIAAAVAAEREACAKLCESMAEDDLGNIGGQCYDNAAAIRARGAK